MKSESSNVRIKTIAFCLILLIVVVFSIPQVQSFLANNIIVSKEVIACSKSIIKPEYIKYFAVGFAITIVPFMILYSIFIYKKFGIFITIFQGKYSPEIHFKEFISLNISNKIFGIAAFLIWLTACCFIFYGIAAFVLCNISK